MKIYIVELEGEGVQFSASTPEIARQKLSEFGRVFNWGKGRVGNYGTTWKCEFERPDSVVFDVAITPYPLYE